MRLALLFLFLSFCAQAQMQPVLFQVESDTIKQWSYFFGDEFNGEEINEELWYPYYPWGGLSLDAGIYAAKDMVEQSDGLIKLKIDTTSEWHSFPKWMLDELAIEQHGIEVRNENQVQLNYLISALWSKRQFRYGYFECRAMSPAGKGLWPGFWLYGGHPNDEIDFMEMKGEKKKHFHVDIHCPNDCDKVKTGWFGIEKNWGGWIKASEELTGKYVVYSGLWMPGKLIIYLNGEAVAEYKGDFGTNMNLIANLSVAQDKGPFSPGPDAKTVFPNEFIVDYMRVWKLNGPEGVRGRDSMEINQPERIENPLVSENKNSLSNARLKRRVRHIFNKKEFKMHLGYVSVIQSSAGNLFIEINGKFKKTASVSLLDSTGNVLSTVSLDHTQNNLDISGFKKGSYVLKLTYEDVSSMAEIAI